ncbi:MAG: hypothetical protein WC875_05405 [Candidatus Absconditabacterales bacterium]
MAKKKRYSKLTAKDLRNPIVGKILLQKTEEQEDKYSKLEKSLKLTQDAFESLREKNHSLEKENILIKDKLKLNFFPEAIKFISSVGIGYVTNVIANGNGSNNRGRGLVGGIVLYLVMLCFQYFRNK